MGEAFVNLLTIIGGICAACTALVLVSAGWLSWTDRHERRKAESRAAHPTLALFESMRDDAIEPHSGTAEIPTVESPHRKWVDIKAERGLDDNVIHFDFSNRKRI